MKFSEAWKSVLQLLKSGIKHDTNYNIDIDTDIDVLHHSIWLWQKNNRKTKETTASLKLANNKVVAIKTVSIWSEKAPT